MLKTYQKRFIFCCLLLLFFKTVFAENQNTVRLALLDTVYNEMPVQFSLLSEYEQAYLAGVKTAAEFAKRYDINIVYQPFFYENANGSLELLAEVPRINAWKADLVLGPSSSDQMLMLKNSLPNTMVLSSYASDTTLKTLPKNFYSVFLPDDQIMDLLAGYIHAKYPQKNIYIIAQIDDKQSVDVSQEFITSYRGVSPKTKIDETKILLDNINAIDSKKLLAGHESDIILIFNSSFYGYNALVQHLTDSMPNTHLIFFSDQDNWGESVVPDNTQDLNRFNYESYRIGPIMEDAQLPYYKEFLQTYNSLYHSPPSDAVSYMTYIATISAIEALIAYPDQNNSDSMREKILYSYATALAHNPNWFRLNDFAIYRLIPQGEILITKLPLSQKEVTK
ncbi:MAG: hypothetical protein NTV32_08185 [Gammaproteobacteria bacterium]|nr:hypothetical protein [Gammaproteobacteria bacterium]